jgi:hypothetical protein
MNKQNATIIQVFHAQPMENPAFKVTVEFDN